MPLQFHLSKKSASSEHLLDSL